jgi:hypothetical protein
LEDEALKTYIAFRNRRLSDYVAMGYRQQIYGTTLGCAIFIRSWAITTIVC